MLVHGDAPFNAEPRPSSLADSAITPLEHFYVRSRGPAADADPHAWRLHVAGHVDQPTRQRALAPVCIQIRAPESRTAA